MFLEEGAAHGLGGVRGEDQVDGLVLEGGENLVRGFVQLLHEALERLVEIGLRQRAVLVADVAFPGRRTAVGNLHLLGQVAQVEHVREGARHHDRLPGVQVVEQRRQLLQLRLVFHFTLAKRTRNLVAFLHLRPKTPAFH
jgi:hypothetical protein